MCSKAHGPCTNDKAITLGFMCQIAACVQDAGSIVWLMPVPYNSALNDGNVAFTINLWFKAGNTTGGLFQYLFSHMGDPDGSEWGPNQV